MADISDVSAALVTLAAGVAYPSGTSQPSIVNKPVMVYPGWPQPQTLDADLAVGKVHVSVFPMPNMERIVDSAMSDWTQATAPANTVTLTLAGQAVTVGGTISTPQNAALVVDGKGYVYAVQPADTLASIASALAALVAVDQTATAAGAVVTVPNAKYISPRVGGRGTSQRETRRQERTFLIAVWANDPALRDSLASKLDAALSNTVHLTLPDQNATLRYRSSRPDDGTQKDRVYRRDLQYAVEYSTIATEADYQITVGVENITAGPSLTSQFAVKTIVE